MSTTFTPVVERWIRATAYWPLIPYDADGFIAKMAAAIGISSEEIMAERRHTRHALKRGWKPPCYPDRLTDGIYFENGLLYRERMAGVHGHAR